MRRLLVICAIVGSLGWTAAGLSVLAVALHEHHHHGHDHHQALQTALHGHAHEGVPDHVHEASAVPKASSTSTRSHATPLALQSQVETDHPAATARFEVLAKWTNEHEGPPTYLMHCALLT